MQTLTQNGLKTNARPETAKSIKANTGTKLPDIGLCDVFVNLTPSTRKMKAKISETTSA